MIWTRGVTVQNQEAAAERLRAFSDGVIATHEDEQLTAPREPVTPTRAERENHYEREASGFFAQSSYWKGCQQAVAVII